MANRTILQAFPLLPSAPCPLRELFLSLAVPAGIDLQCVRPLTEVLAPFAGNGYVSAESRLTPAQPPVSWPRFRRDGWEEAHHAEESGRSADFLGSRRSSADSGCSSRADARAANSRIRVMIVDDEELPRHALRQLLTSHAELEVVAECANGMEAVKAIPEHKPGLIFPDVQMPKLTGFDMLELIGNEVPVIFVTAYDQYAMRAFEVHAVDYLLKPVGKERFEAALERAKNRISDKMPRGDELAAAARPSRQFLERVVVKDGTRVTLIPIVKLDYAEAQDDYVALASGGKKHLKQQTIASLEASLDPETFVRIHRSYIVNLERVARIEPYGKDSRLAILQDGTRLPVSRAGYARLKALLDERA